jgi:hypothetical protein
VISLAKTFYVKMDGEAELKRAIKRLGALPQKCVTPAAKKGATIWLRAIRALAPVGETGELSKGIILKGERRTKKGKKVYDVMMDPAKSDIFAKLHTAGENASAVRNKLAKVGDRVRAYYPASMEFGFFARNGRYIPGYHFMKRGAEENATAARNKTIAEAAKNVDKEWAKKNGT